MRRSYLPFLMILSILISACSTEENMPENNDQPLLKSYKLSKDANGRYAIDVDLVEGAYTETYKDETTNTNTIYAYQGEAGNRSKSSSNTLTLDNNKISVDVYENNVQKNTIWVEDENITLAKGQISPDFLEEYSLEYLGGGEYVLDFKVRSGVMVNFEYNADENIYEVHLKEGTSNGLKFTKLYNKSPNLPLRIDFVNYILINSQARSTETLEYAMTRVPRTGSDGVY
ncbi:hypothetical protein EV195_101632 [Tenacibaculum skagerrakense]|uniref:Uncharacterized protein n=1 Tax=Tenacibaculum skagerrakense TaxID=186571 RepID=A0A4R2P379_9FLAO|nr:hypothetical protein [Tenacibaculum skagerrakense]TCP28454.1 hypothetical protein EV195_101632 [Tenacibaculum skagerrakense]